MSGFLLCRSSANLVLEAPRRLYSVLMNPLVRPYRESDGQVAAAILETVWAGDERRAEDYGWVLEVAGTVQGLGRVLKRNTIHPYMPTLDLAVLDAAYRAGHAPVLLNHLMATFPDGTLWRTQCLESHHVAQDALKASSFAEVRRTWTPQIPLAAYPADWLLAEAQQAGALGYQISLEPVLDEEFRAELTRAHLDRYQSTHRINPPADLPWKTWQTIFMEDLDEVFVARRGGRLAAFASLRGAEVYWFGTLPEFTADADTLNAALKREEFKAGRPHLATLNYELDSTDPAALAVLARLPVPPGEALLTFQTGIPDLP